MLVAVVILLSVFCSLLLSPPRDSLIGGGGLILVGASHFYFRAKLSQLVAQHFRSAGGLFSEVFSSQEFASQYILRVSCLTTCLGAVLLFRVLLAYWQN